MKYSIIIPTYNHCEDLLKPCIESIIKYTNLYDIELIVSANGCTDNTQNYLENLQQSFNRLGFSENLKVIWSAEALGYARACNKAIEIAKADYIVLLNNDTILLAQNRSDWLTILSQPFKTNPQCGVSCVVKDFSEPAGHDFAVFFCVMIARRVFDKIGLLNTDYGLGAGEDTEFCIEAERAGFEVCACVDKKYVSEIMMYSGTFPIYHKGEGTVHDTTLVPDWSKTFTENSIKLSQKYNPAWLKRMNIQAPNFENKHTPNLEKLQFLSYQNLEIYNELIVSNIYQTTEEIVKNKPVIDIGANIGVYSLMCAELGASKVIAVEPVTDTYDQLCKNIEIGKYSTVTPLKKVVSNTSGSFANISLSEHHGHNSLYNISDSFESIPTITLDEILKDCSSNNVVLKLDCEGSEYDILMNVSKEQMSKVEYIMMEIHADMHPIYKGFDVLYNRLKMFNFACLNQIQMFSWQVNEHGQAFNHQPIPVRVEVWKKQTVDKI